MRQLPQAVNLGALKGEGIKGRSMGLSPQEGILPRLLKCIGVVHECYYTVK